jgi:hypothetical protein
MSMGIEFSEALLLVSGGSLLFSFFALVHFASTYNQHNRSLAILSAILIGTASLYSATISTGHGPLTSLEGAMASAIMGILELLPIVLAVVTTVLFRISLLTKRSVGASS